VNWVLRSRSVRMLQRIGVWISREGDRLYYRRHTTNGSISGAATEADHEGGIMTSRLPPHGNRVFVCPVDQSRDR